MSLSQYVHTARYLKPVQIYSRLTKSRRVRDVRLRVLSELRPAHVWTPPIQHPPNRIGHRRFRFLNDEREIVTWNDAGLPKLWLYNLHYFDAPESELIENWIIENGEGIGHGWDPYPLSRRIVNWVKYALSGGTLNAAAQASLAAQAGVLATSLEYDLLANHLFVNGKALLFAGAFFTGQEAERWFAQGLSILSTQVSEQVLSDGGHIERSPMYHALILEDILDLINLRACYALPLPDWSEVASRMLSWLFQMSHPDGEISFFNDAALGIAPPPAQLRDYGSRLGVSGSVVPLTESGYVRLENDRTVVLFDAAPIGPDYQPGHAHADTLSLELSHCGRRILINSGTSTYENNSDRLNQRSTQAHNTVRIDRLNQSEVWSSFRVARRARPFGLKTDRQTYVEAAHTGYHRLRCPVTHRRRVEFINGCVKVTDHIEGRGEHLIEVFWHLYPDADLDVQMNPEMKVSEQPSLYYPEFGVSLPNRTIKASWTGRCPTTITTVFTLS